MCLLVGTEFPVYVSMSQMDTDRYWEPSVSAYQCGLAYEQDLEESE